MEHSNGSKAAILSQNQDGSPGSYALRELINDVPLSTDENGEKAHITCVDTWQGNLYIGTSSGEVLHYVAIPQDPSAGDEADQAGYIFATSIEPPYSHKQEGADAGVKQILLLPAAEKACILCNGTLTFYTLPELTPAFDGKIKQGDCRWVGGLDRDLPSDPAERTGVEVIVICLRQRLRMIGMGRSPRVLDSIELGGVTAIERRGDLACIADGESYALLDVVNQRQNVLFPISSSADEKPLPEIPPEPSSSHSRQTSKNLSPARASRESRSHERNISVGGTPRNSSDARAQSGSPWPSRTSSHQASSVPAHTSSRTASPTKDAGGRTNPATPDQQPSPERVKVVKPLQPNLISPTPGEFFLTTGTTISDPGIGMFVNLDGDVVRGTIEFSSYPESLVLDGAVNGNAEVSPITKSQEGCVLAIVRKKGHRGTVKGIEIQRWDVDPTDSIHPREWLPLRASNTTDDGDEGGSPIGLRNSTSTVDVVVNDISTSLRSRRLRFKEVTEEVDAMENTRNQEEDKFASRFSNVQAKVLLFEESRVSWVIRHPLLIQLDHQLNAALHKKDDNRLSVDVPSVQRVINSIRGQDPRDELEFLTLTYVRQKASLLLFGSLIIHAANHTPCQEQDKRLAEEALVDGQLDPRPILTLAPPLQEEIAEGPQGIWLPQGLRDVLHLLRNGFDATQLAEGPRTIYNHNILHVIKNYLLVWRKKKGFGSVADEAYVFRTVDAALLRILLLLDADSPRGPAGPGSIRAELNSVVDSGVECFERAVELFKKFDRLYMLSRLYQSRKMVAQVLIVWKRILEGEKDLGGEFIDGEMNLRRYLTKISDSALVLEYGCWLANRNPRLGVQVFADNNSKVKFQPTEAVAILKEKAPGAVKDYLEHLVFDKNHVQYVNDLIAFYLDTVLQELTDSPDARRTLVDSYETYRRLPAPKPPYRQFLADQPLDAEWWHNRLRLLQLIGGSHGAATQYDVGSLARRLAPFHAELVPESIILHSRQGAHQQALHLLVHALGDYDTAVRYCLLGGANLFHPRRGGISHPGVTAEGAQPQHQPTHAEQAAFFAHLLQEFFQLADEAERLQRTAELLDRFGAWFDVAAVLASIPDEWSVELVAGFLQRAFRRLVWERQETEVVKALCVVQHFKRTAEFVDLCEKIGATVVRSEEVEGQVG